VSNDAGARSEDISTEEYEYQLSQTDYLAGMSSQDSQK